MAKRIKEVFTNKTANFLTSRTDFDDHRFVSIQISATNTVTLDCNVTLQVSNDENWVDVTDTLTNITTASPEAFFDLTSAAGALRLKIDFVAGTSDFEINYILKV